MFGEKVDRQARYIRNREVLRDGELILDGTATRTARVPAQQAVLPFTAQQVVGGVQQQEPDLFASKQKKSPWA